MGFLTSQLGSGRTFTTHGERLITCDVSCGLEESANGLQVEWMALPGVACDSVTEAAPACMASDAPHQGEEATYAMADEVAAIQSPRLHGGRLPPRACLRMAGLNGVVVREVPSTPRRDS